MEISSKTKLSEIAAIPEFLQMENSFINGWQDRFRKGMGNKTLADLESEHAAWNAQDMIAGLENLQRVAKQEKQYVFRLSDKSNFIYLPAIGMKKDHYFVLCAGGSYGSVCTMVESLPVASRLNELGFDCFCLNYHVADASSFIKGLMPKPLNDLADVFRNIEKNEDRFGLKTENCFLAGFSAGGHLAACYGIDGVGARHYGLKQPKGLLLVYPLISASTIEEEKIRKFLLSGLFGLNKDRAKDYEITERMDDAYPQTFYIYCKDDDTVSEKNPLLMEKSLKKNGIRHKIVCYPEGGHGFGLGSRAPGSGYIDLAVDFLVKGEENE